MDFPYKGRKRREVKYQSLSLSLSFLQSQKSMASKDKKTSKASSSRSGGIRTLSDLNRRSADSDSDSDAPQEYYTGGEKRSFS